MSDRSTRKQRLLMPVGDAINPPKEVVYGPCFDGWVSISIDQSNIELWRTEFDSGNSAPYSCVLIQNGRGSSEVRPFVAGEMFYILNRAAFVSKVHIIFIRQSPESE